MCVDRRNYLIPQLHLMPFSRHCQCENQKKEMMAAFSWLGFAFTWRNHHPALRGTGDRPPEARLQKRANRNQVLPLISQLYLFDTPPIFPYNTGGSPVAVFPEGGDRMRIYEALSLMIAFGTLIAIIISLVIMLVK